MRYLLILLVGICFHLGASAQNTDISQKSKPTTLKVLLLPQASDVLLEVKGRHYIYNPLDGTEISRSIVSKRFPIKAEEYGIHWGEKFPGSFQLRFVPGDSQSSILVNGIQYRGCVEIYLKEGKFNVINEVDIENYLKSTLSSEFTSPLPDEEMSAISIVARTHAYFTAQKNKHAFWHVAASDVGYQGASMLAKPCIEKAVNGTYHLILTYQGTPFAASWTQNSAGKTADFATIFRKAILTPPGVQAPIAMKDRKFHEWSFTYPKERLSQALDLSKVTAVDLYVAPDSEKVYGIKISDDDRSKDCDFITFQQIIGKEELRSNDFKIQEHGDELIFTGFGDGPGVGLCLYSAKVLAEKGQKAPQILQAFFPETLLEKVR
jgi:stage II sporulation protein D